MKKIKIILITFTILALIIFGFVIYKLNFTNDDLYLQDKITGVNTQINIHDGVYTIDGQKIALKNGISKIEAAPGSASKIVTKYFGNNISGDFDGDGRDDTAFLLTQETGGSGVFYYVVALLNKIDGKIGTDGVLIGDRISPQAMGIKNKDILIVNYADRKPGESFAISPSVGKSIYLKLDVKTSQWGLVANNFEGEADPARMTLDMKKWEWINTQYSDDKEIKPTIPKRFILTFNKNKTFSATTDCNTINGEYIVDGNKISFNKTISTLMYCDNSQESAFTKILTETQGYLFTSKGELVLTMKFDSGSSFFK